MEPTPPLSNKSHKATSVLKESALKMFDKQTRNEIPTGEQTLDDLIRSLNPNRKMHLTDGFTDMSSLYSAPIDRPLNIDYSKYVKQ